LAAREIRACHGGRVGRCCVTICLRRYAVQWFFPQRWSVSKPRTNVGMDVHQQRSTHILLPTRVVWSRYPLFHSIRPISKAAFGHGQSQIHPRRVQKGSHPRSSQRYFGVVWNRKDTMVRSLPRDFAGYPHIELIRSFCFNRSIQPQRPRCCWTTTAPKYPVQPRPSWQTFRQV